MQPSDARGFRAAEEDLDAEAYLRCTYAIECEGDPEHAAAVFCSEQSTAQWQRPGVAEDLRPRFGAKLLDLEVCGERETASYGLGAPGSGPVQACRITVAHPHGNFGPRIPNMLSALLGEGAFYSPQIPVVRLLDLTFPDTFLADFDGPSVGADGLRDLLDVHDRPLFFAVIKPNIGLPPEPFAEIGYAAWVGGVDVAKDDEMLADTPWCPFTERTRLLGAARRDAEDATGRAKLYLAHVTDEVDRMRELVEIGVGHGANAVLVNTGAVGYSATRALRSVTDVPIVGHLPINAALSRPERYGVHSRVLTALQRLSGCDAMVMPGFAPRMRTPAEEVRACIDAAGRPMGRLPAALPALGGGVSAASVADAYAKVGSVGFGLVAGRGVANHPLGPQAGARSLLQAWDAAAAGRDAAEAAGGQPELAAALEAFGDRP